jgi:predicted phage terminase large subunit-like protein
MPSKTYLPFKVPKQMGGNRTTKTVLTSDLIYGFTSTVLMARFDTPVTTPMFHRQLWELMCSVHDRVAVAAPRRHAKSTAVTHAYVLANVLFKCRDHVLIVSDTEGQAINFLQGIKSELQDNDVLVHTFNINTKFRKDRENEIVVAFNDGEEFRIIAKGSEQKLRGTIWRQKRPNLIVGDDLENDEIVMNDERRDKFKRWFYNALLPCGSKDCKIRVVGTILHLGALLESFMPKLGAKSTVIDGLMQYSTLEDPEWFSVRYKAHNEDFSQILWPEQINEFELRKIQKGYIEQGIPEGYAQEYLNYPIDLENAYFKRHDFKPIGEECPEIFYMSADFAISQKDHAAYTVFIVASITHDNRMRVKHVRRFRGDSLEIIDTLFNLYTSYNPELVFIEQENIARALGPVINKAMEERNLFPRIEPMTASQDKVKRARALQARMRAGLVEFNMDADWYPTLEHEMTTFPRGEFMDQVDALAWMALGIEKFYQTPTVEDLIEEQYDEELEEDFDPVWLGMSGTTGY